MPVAASTPPAPNASCLALFVMWSLTQCSIKIVKFGFGCGRDFCFETSVHGFIHIATEGRHWIERVLWALTTAGAIWAATSVSLGQWQRYSESPTVITLEKDFRTWLFDLPAITYCDYDRVDRAKLPDAIFTRWAVKPDDEKYSYYARFVSTVANADLFHLAGFEEFKDDASLDVDMYKLVLEVMPQSQIKATWSTEQATRWFRVITEAGACYATNSLALADVAVIKPMANDTTMFPITCKYSSLSCYVILEIVTKALFYVHSPYDVVDIMSDASLVYPSLNRITELSVMETGCGRGVRNLAPKRRGCLFTDEAVGKGRKVYSTNTCRLSCRSQLAVKLCGCKPFYYIYEEGPVCSPAGMRCLSQYAARLASNDGVKCACSPQCLEATFRDLSTNDEIWGKGPFATRAAVRFTVQPPRTRYTREIVFNFQDLVVSFGGAAGLFLGASFISFVEIIYFLVERTVRPCVKRRGTARVGVIKNKEQTLSYEAARILELTTILDDQRLRRLDPTRF